MLKRWKQNFYENLNSKDNVKVREEAKRRSVGSKEVKD